MIEEMGILVSIVGKIQDVRRKFKEFDLAF